jgi:hypothetical protein
MTVTRSEARGRPREKPTAIRAEKPRKEKSRTEEGKGSSGGRPPHEEVTPQQLRAIASVLAHPTVAAAAKEIGVHPRTISRWFKEPAFMAEYVSQMSELQLVLWSQMLGVRNEVWSRFLELMRSPDERVALRATTWALDRLLSVPAILNRIAIGDEEAQPSVPPRVRALLEQVDAGRGDGDGGA